MRPTAMGYYVLLVPAEYGDRWMVVGFDKQGQWRFSRVYPNLQIASKERRRLVYLHRSMKLKSRKR